MKIKFKNVSVDDADKIFELEKGLIEKYETDKSLDFEKVFAWVKRKIENNIESYKCIYSNEEYKQWLIRSDAASNAKGLNDWKVPTNIYWLYVDGHPVGIGKLRHFLTDRLREEGGHAGCAIRPSERNKGYGTTLLKLLIGEANKMNIDKVLVTIRKNNASSLKVALKNNGKIEKSNEERYYIWIDC